VDRDATSNAGQGTTYHFSLRASCFVRFLSAELAIAGGDRASASLAVSESDYVYNGTMSAASSRRLHDSIVSALHTYGRDPAWSHAGLDGTDYRGSFDSAALSVADFRFWSPEPGTPAHALACAALDVVPIDHSDGSFEYGLEGLREALSIGVPLRWVWSDPPRLRIVGSLSYRTASQVESALSDSPAAGDLIVDVRLCDLHSIRRDFLLPIEQLAHRTPPPTWLISHDWQLEFLEAMAVPRRCIVQDASRESSSGP